MEYKRFQNKIVLRIDRGEEIVSSITKLCKKENICLASISGIGAVSEAKIGIYNVETKEYFSKELEGLFEMSNLMGNVTQMNGETYLHLHITIGNIKDNQVYAGHLNSAVIGATSEIFLDILDGKVNRFHDEELGLNLFKF